MAHFGWSWHYLRWGIKWPIVQRMLADGPDYGSKKEQEDNDMEAMRKKIDSIKRG